MVSGLNSLQKSASDKSNETLQAIENRIHGGTASAWLSNNISTEQPKLNERSAVSKNGG